MRKITIILPVYNGIDFVRSCINSIIANTESGTYEILIIDDCSTEIALQGYFSSLLDNKLIKIIRNENNQGFVASVNVGMRATTNDVILLNSDTEVTPGWLEKLEIAAYSQLNIATVTPLSNNATICSIPNFCEDNTLPAGYSLNEFSALIERFSLRLYPEIPTAVGFCMYIKREVLNIIGYFNEQLFGKGYGEENEFSLRAKRLGYINILDDTTYILHKGSMTFSDSERKIRVAENVKKVERLHPGYQKSIEQFITTNPLKPIHDNIHLSLKIFRKKNNILFIKNYEQTKGGIGSHVTALLNNISQISILVLEKLPIGLIRLTLWDEGKEIHHWTWQEQAFTNNSFFNASDESLLRNIIQYFNVKLVHFHHTLGFSLSILNIPKEFHVPRIITIHDYFLIDEHNFYDGSLLNKYLTILKYQEAIGTMENGEHVDPRYFRLKCVQNYLRDFDLVVVPSKATVKDVAVLKLPENIKVLPHGANLPKSIKPIDFTKNKLNVAYIGTTALHKGFDDYATLATNSVLMQEYNFFLIGSVTAKYQNKIKNITVSGEYEIEQLPSLLRKYDIDLVIIPSIFPETYSYVLSESVQNNIPVLARDFAALGSRIKSEKLGLSFSDLDDLIDLLLKISKDREIISKQYESIKLIKIRSAKDMAQDYIEIYNKLMDKNKSTINECNQTITSFFNNSSKDNSILNIQESNSSGALNELIEFRSFKQGMIWKLLMIYRNFKSKL
ncbi:MAG: glycosyltransferase [bacterium]